MKYEYHFFKLPKNLRLTSKYLNGQKNMFIYVFFLEFIKFSEKNVYFVHCVASVDHCNHPIFFSGLYVQDVINIINSTSRYFFTVEIVLNECMEWTGFTRLLP